MSEGWLKTESRDGLLRVQAGGAWDINSAGRLDAQLRPLSPDGIRRLDFDLSEVGRLDTAGAWLTYRTAKTFTDAGCDTAFAGVRPEHQAMLDQVAESDQPCEVEPRRLHPVVALIDQVGVATVGIVRDGLQQIAFLGEMTNALARTFAQPRRLRFTPLVFHMEKAGFNAIPIVALISFLIGVVLAYQGAVQLQQFGADIFVVDLIAISVLREIGILLTAIVIAGRSGSAFTAELGSMVVNEEVDAIRSLGLDPIDVLVVPRLLALVITLPLLAFIADMMGLFGGMVMAWTTLDISPGLYVERLNEAVSISSFWVGIVKAPVFAFVIAMVGCMEGLRVERKAESIGRQTTRSVVTAIFMVIVFDAVFSIFFAMIGV